MQGGTDMGKRLKVASKGPLLLFLLFLLFLLQPVAAKASSAGGGPDDPAAGWDHLFHEMLIDITVIGLVFALVTLYLMVKYRRKDPSQQGTPVRLSRGAMLGWALIPAFFFMADDFYLALKGWDLFNDYRNVPEESYEIKLESRLWNWSFTYPNGVKTMDELRVPEGKPVVLRMTSADVVHSLFLPDFRVKEDSMPGRITYLWFHPRRVPIYMCRVLRSPALKHERKTDSHVNRRFLRLVGRRRGRN
jgi:cytochrome c oxidase subunit 2